MEEEIKCPLCKQLFSSPVLLPCYHALCLNCVARIQQPIVPLGGHTSVLQNSQSNFNGHSHVLVTTTATVHFPSPTINHNSSSDTEDGNSDQVSILSDTDSGVVVCGSGASSSSGSFASRPSPSFHTSLFPPLQTRAYVAACPVCHKVAYLDETGAHSLPKYRVMQNVVDKFLASKSLGAECQLCEKSPKAATVMCVQCEIFYCEVCLESCHPPRGPLAAHNLVSPAQGKQSLKAKGGDGTAEFRCSDHPNEPLSLYCTKCKTPVCVTCRKSSNKHFEHEIVPVQVISKTQKTELSANLQQLSEKAKSGGEFIQRLKNQTEKINENCSSMENLVTAQIDGIVCALEERKSQLIANIRREKECKLRSLKAQVSSHSAKLQQTTSLIQFCIEALKEADACAYLQVGSLLLGRVLSLESAWQSDDDSASSISGSSGHISIAGRINGGSGSSSGSSGGGSPYNSALFSSDFDLTLDDRSVLAAIRQLNFIQMKPAKNGEERRPAVPGAALIIPEDCGAENNSVTVAWQPPPTSFVEGYVLEIDDGAGGIFREVYCGKETICTVDGLHFNSIYNARVKAFNSTGEGEYSQVVSLQTAEVAWFSFDATLLPQGVRLSNENYSVTSDCYEPRVALGNVGFARGVHYWEFTIDKYDASSDPCFGFARMDVNKEEMLGKDDKGWGMYIDHQRSWFMHRGAHSSRTEGGIGAGSTIGVLLDMDRRQASFYVNERPQGSTAFSNLYGVVYPAVSLNCNVALTLHTGLDPPSSR